MRATGWISSSLCALSLVCACKKDEPTVSSAVVAASAVATAPNATVTASASPSSAAVASASARPVVVTRSARPTPREWCEAPVALLGFQGEDEGSEIEACKMATVREWSLLWCPVSGRRSGGKDLGNYDRALPAGGSIANAAEVAAGTRGAAQDAVIVSLRPGTRAKPTFTYRPQNHPEWLRDESFTLELASNAASLDERTFGGGAWPSATPRDSADCARFDAPTDAPAVSASNNPSGSPSAPSSVAPTDESKPLADIDGLAAPPTDEAWAASKEAMVSGSDALGCKTKTIDAWFWMRCEGKMKATQIEIEKGRHETQTKASVDGAVVSLVTPYVEGTELRAKITSDLGERFLLLRWGKGKRPLQIGSFVDAR